MKRISTIGSNGRAEGKDDDNPFFLDCISCDKVHFYELLNMCLDGIADRIYAHRPEYSCIC